MAPEVLSLLFSFAALVSIPSIIVFILWAMRRKTGKETVAWSALYLDGAIALAITVTITLVLCVVLRAAGYFDAQFYRPSHRDFGMQVDLGLDPEMVSFESADGTVLAGWLLRAREPVRGTVIYYQGSDRNITYTSRHVYWLTEHGLNVFLFDYRGFGLSDGSPSRRGLVEDSVAAVDMIIEREDSPGARIVLYGQSMGGQLALNAAAVRQDSGIRLVVAEATYSNQRYHLSDKLGRLGPLWLVKWGGWLLTSSQLSGESAIRRLQATPVLLIHGDVDTGVAPYHSDRLYARASGPVTLWRYAGYEHLRIFDDASNRERLVRMILEHLPGLEDNFPLSESP